ncbi:MAG: hypothetical protein EHM58_13675 [Ignavibacteriae bacterium]|nr:MAG: hypothetical protein EHM58_13675 [Ignavibacteriota bacterium]
MNKIILFLFLMPFFSNLYPQAIINSYDIYVVQHESKTHLLINAKVSFEIDNPVDTFELLFSSKNQVENIAHYDENHYKKVDYYSKGKDTMVIILSEQMKKDKKFTIVFDYMYPVIDTIILLDRGHRWYPMIADNIFTFKTHLLVPANYIALTAGNLINEVISDNLISLTYESTVHVFKLPLFITNEKNYVVKECKCSNINTLVFLLPSSENSAADTICYNTCSFITHCNSAIGEYRFNRLVLVESAEFDGANLGSSFITLGSDVIKNLAAGYNEQLFMALASQWYGAGIFPKLFCKGFWFLSVSVPQYLRLMYIQETKGEEAFQKELNMCLDAYKKVEGSKNDMPIIEIDFPNTKEKGILIYGKGVVVLDLLRKQMGEENWRIFTKDFYFEFSGRNITLKEFTGYIDKYDNSGKTTKYFFKLLEEKGL